MRLSVELAAWAREQFWSSVENCAERLPPLIAASIGPFGACQCDGSEYHGNYRITSYNVCYTKLLRSARTAILARMNHMLLVGLLGLAAVALCWSLAVVLFRVGPAGGVARKLAVLLVVEGVTLVTAGFPEFVLGLSENFWFEHKAYTTLSGLVHLLGDAVV